MTTITHAQAVAELEHWDWDTFAVRVLETGQIAWVQRYAYTHAILLMQPGEDIYGNRWCYHSQEAAEAALRAWDVSQDREPAGWHRNPPTGRRRPEGDPFWEYIHF